MSTALSLDHVIGSSGRLRILAALAAERRLNFVGLRQRTQLTDGNLATHARRLESAGFVSVEKSFQDRKPVTHMTLTATGREALERHARELLEALGALPAAESCIGKAASMEGPQADHWVD